MTVQSLMALLEDHPDIWMLGAEPCIRDTDNAVKTVVHYALQEGKGFVRDHFHLREDQIDNALKFALAEWLIHDRAAQEEEGQGASGALLEADAKRKGSS